MKNNITYRKRTIECAAWREEAYFNMDTGKSSLNLLQLHHIARIHCRKGEKISFPLVDGRFWVFCITTAEKSSFTLNDGGKGELTPCDLIVRAPDIQYDSEMRKKGEQILESTVYAECERYYLGIERNIYMEQMFHLDSTEIIHLKDPAPAMECIDSLLHIVEQDMPFSQQEVSCILFRFLTYVTSGKNFMHDFASPYAHLIDQVRHYPQDYPSLKVLEAAFKVSREKLRKIFWEYTSLSPMDFVVKARLDNSCWMLIHSSLSIREIAELNGYKDAAFYSAAFKKIYGISPVKLRKNANDAEFVKNLPVFYKKQK